MGFVLLQILPLQRCNYGTNYTGTGLESLFTSHRNSWRSLPVLRLRIGQYSFFIDRWLENIERHHFCFIRFEDYVEDPNRMINDKIYPFLNLQSQHEMTETSYKHSVKHKNDNRYYKGVSMHNKTRDLLTEFYRPFNEGLAKLLNDDSYLWLDT